MEQIDGSETSALKNQTPGIPQKTTHNIYKNVCEATKTTESLDKNMYFIQRTFCSHILATAVFCSALYQNDKERLCILPHITNLHEGLALLKKILILNQEPLGHTPLYAVYHPSCPQNQPTLNVPVQVCLLKSENTPAFYSDKSGSNSKPVCTRGPLTTATV
jgi:hypothetical protein